MERLYLAPSIAKRVFPPYNALSRFVLKVFCGIGVAILFFVTKYFPSALDSELNHHICPKIWILNLINDESPPERQFNLLMPWKFFQEGFL
jgi:hypothetical protein